MIIVGLILDTAVVVGMMCEESGRHVNMGLLCLARARCFASSVVTPRGYKSEQLPSCAPTSSHTISHCLLASFHAPKEREGEGEGDTKGRFLGLASVASPSLSSHGGTRLDPFLGHVDAPVEPHEHGVHDGGRASNLPRG
jgi:hypothetical protein